MFRAMRALLLCLATLGEAASDALNFLVMGDWGGSASSPYTTPGEVQTAAGMNEAAGKLGAKFALALGDNFYTHGLTNSTASVRFAETFEGCFKGDALSSSSGFEFQVVAGNHDHLGDVQVQIDYSKKSRRWNFPSEYYSMQKTASDGAKVDFVMIDTVQLCGQSQTSTDPEAPQLTGSELPGPSDLAAANAQLDFIKKTLEGSTADFIIVAGHYPVYSVGEHGPTRCLQEQLRPLLLQHKVSAYLNGHDHNEQHIDVGDGVQYHVIGSAHLGEKSTAHAKTIEKSQLKFYSASNGGFATVAVTRQGMVITHVDGSGKPLYTAPAILNRSASPTPPSPSPPGPSPPGGAWECHQGYTVQVGTDTDLDGTGPDIGSCEQRCKEEPGCEAVTWHKTDKHCHLKTGSFSHGDFLAGLKADKVYDACFLSKATQDPVAVV